MRRLCVFWIMIVTFFPPVTTEFTAKWTNADKDDSERQPMSKRYRDKLEELEAKVGAEKFKELTGMTPPSLTKSGRAKNGKTQAQILRGGFQAVLETLSKISDKFLKSSSSSPSPVRDSTVRITQTAAITATAVIAYRLWMHRERTGFRVPSLLLPGDSHASLLPPPRQYILDWLRRCGEATTEDADNGDEDILDMVPSERVVASANEEDDSRGKPKVRRLLLGDGEVCFRCAQNAMHSLRMCEGDEAVEISNLDFVGPQRFRQSRTAISRRRLQTGVPEKLAAVLLPQGHLWWLLPFQVASESRNGQEDSKTVDHIQLVSLDNNSPWSGEVNCKLVWEHADNQSRTSMASSGNVYFSVTIRERSSARASSSLSSLAHEHQATILEALAEGMDRVVAKDITTKTARAAGHKNYQAEADRALREKRRRERKEKMRRSDLLAARRFRGGECGPVCAPTFKRRQ